MISVPKLNHTSPLIVCGNLPVRQDKSCGARAFACWHKMLKGRHRASADAKGPVVHQERLSTSASNAKGLCVWIRHKMSVYDELG